MSWYLRVLKKYADFGGRARRKEYWMFVLFNIIFSAVAVALDNVLGIAMQGVGYGPLYILYSLAVLIPALAAGVRRMHDTGRSGWWLLVPIANLVFALQDSQPGENEYGPNPKESTAGQQQ